LAEYRAELESREFTPTLLLSEGETLIHGLERTDQFPVTLFAAMRRWLREKQARKGANLVVLFSSYDFEQAQKLEEQSLWMVVMDTFSALCSMLVDNQTHLESADVSMDMSGQTVSMGAETVSGDVDEHIRLQHLGIHKRKGGVGVNE